VNSVQVFVPKTLGGGWRDQEREWQQASSSLAPNQPDDFLSALHLFPGLIQLSISDTNVANLSPLAQLHSLKSLQCSYTHVSDLSPLAQLHSLQSLQCSRTKVSDLSPLAQLHSLQSLDCDWTQVGDLPEALVWLASLRMIYLFSTRISDIPAEVLSQRSLSLGHHRPRVRDPEREVLEIPLLHVRTARGVAELQDGSRAVSPAHPGLPPAGLQDVDAA
jgi:Leucine-rich repeat (LRR) protein